MKRFFSHPALALLLAFAASPSAAQTYPVDDSASQVLGGTLRLTPESLPARGAPMYMVAGEMAVLVRLDVSPWRGRRGRLYLRLPEQSAGAITATWTTRGRLLPGALRAGERALVYAGLIGDASLEDTLRMRIDADGRTLPPSEQLAFSFEIELDSP
jgi:hypothetical protein